MEPRLRLRRFRLERGSNTGVSDQNRLRPSCADVTIAVSFSQAQKEHAELDIAHMYNSFFRPARLLTSLHKCSL